MRTINAMPYEAGESLLSDRSHIGFNWLALAGSAHPGRYRQATDSVG